MTYELHQDEKELEEFIALLREERVCSYLEIGSMWGGSLWRIVQALPAGSRVVSVDSMTDRPEAHWSLVKCVGELRKLGYDAHFIMGDSTNQQVVEQVRALGPFDALFIDGNHSAPFVLADWRNYGPMARVVAFHDINWNNTWKSGRGNTPDEIRMAVPRVWQELKQNRRHQEFKYHPEQNYFGIGVLWT